MTHINWTGCGDFHEARAALASMKLGATLYGNFADIDMKPGKLRRKLEAAGFKVDQVTGAFNLSWSTAYG